MLALISSDIKSGAHTGSITLQRFALSMSTSQTPVKDSIQEKVQASLKPLRYAIPADQLILRIVIATVLTLQLLW